VPNDQTTPTPPEAPAAGVGTLPVDCDRSLLSDRDLDPLAAPLQGDLVVIEVDIQLVALDRAAAVDDLDGLATGVAGDDQLRAEGQDIRIGGHELAVVVTDMLAAGGQALGLWAAADGARAVGR